jgi:diguanylate cyclase (GGDEF)-like protein/PAS domain S-box-containing protein
VGVLVSIACGLVIVKPGRDRLNELDRDLLDALLENIPDNVFFKDRESRFLRISRAMAIYCGLKDPTQALDKSDADIFTSEHAVQALEDEKEILRTGQPMIAKEEKETWPDGHETWVVTTKMPLKNKHGEIVGTMGITHNITAQRQAEMQVRYIALHDSLTGLPNRFLFQDRLSQSLASAIRNQGSGIVLMLDVDRLKNINDLFGHNIGDRLLESLAKRLTGSFREIDTVARLGSDEFALVLLLTPDSGGIESVAKKALGLLTTPFQIEGRALTVSATMGISRFPEDSENPDTLLQFADAAMYEAKKTSPGKYCMFSADLTQATQHRQKLEYDLIQAFERDQFVLHYQPIVSTDSGRIAGVEALLRWLHPEHGLILPSEFIPQLEQLGMMVEVGRWVLRTACRQNVAWQEIGIPPIRVAVNVSSQQFLQGEIVDTVLKVLHETGLDPEFLELELTESQALGESPVTFKTMQHLKRIGVSLSLDDFGTGWSSMSYLRNYPINRIKIDRSFVRDLPSQPAAESVVKSILSLSNSLRIPCIAEGVENSQQLDYLKKNMCSEMQGFLFSPPLAATDCTAMLRSRKFEYKSTPVSLFNRSATPNTEAAATGRW